MLFKYELRHLILLRFVTWRIGIDSGWTARPGFFGRGMPALMSAALWEEWRASERFLSTPEEIWAALWRTIDLFRGLASGLARNLGIVYRETLDETLTAYLHSIRDLPRT